MEIISQNTEITNKIKFTIPALFLIENNLTTKTVKINKGYLFYDASLTKISVSIKNSPLNTVSVSS